MAENIYDEVEIEDMEYDPTLQIYHYPCPCGDRFEIGIADLRDGEEIAVCPSCSLMIKVIYEVVSKSLLLTVVYRVADITCQILGRSPQAAATCRTKYSSDRYSLNTRDGHILDTLPSAIIDLLVLANSSCVDAQ